MRGLGIIIAVFSAIFLFFTLSMDTSVSTSFGNVNNIGLMNDKQNYLMVSGLGIIVGIVLAALAGSGRGNTVADDKAVYKTCPSCAENIKIEAIKCRYCGQDFDPEMTEANAADYYERAQIRSNAVKKANRNGNLGVAVAILLLIFLILYEVSR